MAISLRSSWSNSNANAIENYTPDPTWNSFYQLYPQFHPSNRTANWGYGEVDPKFRGYRPKNNDYSLYLGNTASPISESLFGLSPNKVPLKKLGLKQSLDSYNKIVSAPLKTDIGTVLKNFPEAKYWSDETLKAFADNYRLGIASLYEPNQIIENITKSGKTLVPIVTYPGDLKYTFQGNKYNAITDPKQIKFDPVYGFVIDKQYKTPDKSHSTGLIGRFVDSLSSSPLPTLGLLASAYFGLPATGLGETAGTAAGAAAAPTGLASLPTAGSTAASGVGTFGAAADAALGTGMITSPGSLASLVSAAPIGTTIPAAAGGFLNPALAGGLAGAGAAAGGALSGGLPDFNPPFQSPGSVSTVGESTGLGSVGSTAPDLGTGMITSPEGLSGLVNSQPIGTTLGEATPGTTGGYLVPSLGGEALATTAAAGAVDAGAAAGGAIGETPAVSGNTLGQVGMTNPDLGTGMITSPEGLSGLVNSDPIGTSLGAATPGTTGGYLVPSLGGEALATTAAAGGLASSSSVTDWLGNVFNQGVDKFMSDPLKNTLNLVSGISSYLGNNAQAKALEDYLKKGLSQSDPFGSQRAYYMDRLKSTYTNPEGYLTSPEYKAISKRRLEALERADAAQGRRSQYGARAEKMHEFDLENLNKERLMLAQLAGSGINPSQVSSLLGSLGTGSATAQANAPGNLLFMLNEIFGGKK